jgi:diguanylate cyclase (GGDEF)-like protein
MPLAALDLKHAPQDYIHEVWQQTEGLPQLTVETIFQDRNGYIWVGTQSGAARFDGIVFDMVGRDIYPDQSIRDVSIIFEDSLGGLWFGTSGYGLHRLFKGQFTHFGIDSGIAGNFIEDLYEDCSQTLWMATEAGMSLYDLKTGEFRMSSGQRAFQGKHLYGFAAKDCEPPIIAAQGGLFAEHGGYWKPYPLDTSLEEELIVKDAVFDLAGGIWIATSNAGLLYYGGGSHLNYSKAISNLPLNVRTLQWDKHGALWVGTDNGVARLSSRGLELFKTEHGLSFPIVTALFEDREGHLWIGTLGGGLNRLRDTFIVGYNQTDGFPGNTVLAFTVTKDGTRWVGTEAGLYCWDQEQPMSFTTARNQLPSNAVFTLEEDQQSRLWVGTSQGIAIIEDRQVVRQITSLDGLPGDWVRALYSDARGWMWVGTRAGLCIWKPENPDQFERVSSLPSEKIRDIVADSEGFVWVATESGLVRFQADEAVQVYGQLAGLKDTFILSLYADPVGGLWIGTNADGLYYYDQGKFTAFNQEKGLCENTIYRVIEDDQGQLWMSSTNGVSMVVKQHLLDFDQGLTDSFVCHRFDERDGLPNRECVGAGSATGIHDEAGFVWIATASGLAQIDPRHSQKSIQPPPVQIKRLFVDEVLTPVDFTQPVVLGPGTNKFEIEFVALSFANPKRIAYRHRLEGYEDDFSSIRPRRSSIYTNLEPGTYQFIVEARYPHSEFSEAVSVQLEIQPYFWQTTWFYIFCAVVLACLVWLFIKLKLRRIALQKIELEKLVQDRTQQLARANQDLEQKSQALQDANRKLSDLTVTDPLTGLKNRRYLKDYITKDVAQALRCYRFKQVDKKLAFNDLYFLMVDVDHFKRINDNFGHDFGDKILVRTSNILLEACRESDLVIRWGGEEFLVVGRFGEKREPSSLAERIRSSMETHPYKFENGETLRVTCSVGFACFPFFRTFPTSLSWEQVLRLADRALYAAKKSGRNAWVGLHAGPLGSRDGISERVQENFEGMLHSGELRTETSFLDDRPLQW